MSVSFQSYIKKILIEKLDILTIVYLYNIDIYTDKQCYVDFIKYVFNKLIRTLFIPN